MEDRQIVALFLARSERAIEELSQKHGSTLRRVSEHILNNPSDAEECVNDTYLAVWNAIPPHQPDHLLAFVCRIARNLSIKRRNFQSAKKRNNRYDLALEELEHTLSCSEYSKTPPDAEELSAYLDAFLDGLPQRDRVLFVKRYWFSESVEELACAFGMTRHHVSVVLARTRKKLKLFLTEKGVYL